MVSRLSMRAARIGGQPVQLTMMVSRMEAMMAGVVPRSSEKVEEARRRPRKMGGRCTSSRITNLADKYYMITTDSSLM